MATEESNNEPQSTNAEKSKRRLALKIAQISGFVLLCVIFALLTINSLLSIFMKHYYPTYGDYRLFAIVSDSMEGDSEDSIPKGNMIVARVPKSPDEIEVGTVITYELKQGDSIVLITHRVTAVNYDETTQTYSYTTRGDNAQGTDAVRPAFDDVVGIFTGKQCGFFGYFFGFLQSAEGAITLIIILLIIVLTALIIHFVNLINVWRTVALNALKKSGSFLNDIDNIEELGTIADVIGIVSKDPEGKADIKRKDEKLNWYIRMNALPKRPYPNDLEEYLKLAGDDLKPVPVPKLKYADDEDIITVEKVLNTEEEATVEQTSETTEKVETEQSELAMEEEAISDSAEEEIPTVEDILNETEEQPEEETEIEEEPEEEVHVEESVPDESEHVVTIEEILSEAENEPEDEAPDIEMLPDEEEPQEEVRSVDNVTGMAVIVRYKKSFTAKLIQSDDKIKAYYSLLKNELLSYNKIKNRISWNHENFNSGRNNIVRFSIRGKSLCIYFALDPDGYVDTKYKVEYAQSKKYENVPCLYRVKNARRVKYALDLIAAVAEKFGLEKGAQQNVNYYMHYEPTQPLIERGLIKELVSEEDYVEFMRQYSRKEVDRNRRSFVSAKEVNSVIPDEVAIALVEDKRENKVKASGKKDIINVDVLSENFEENAIVNIDSLKQKGLIGKNVGSVKVLARGTLTKPLIVEAQDFSIEAVKMIVLTGGKATKV